MRSLALVCCASLLALAPCSVAAQRPDTAMSARLQDPRLRQLGLSPAEVLERLRATGMTRQQVAAELERRGYDPTLVDPYFDVLERESTGRNRTGFLDSLAVMGLASDTVRALLRAQDRTERLLTPGADALDLESLFGAPADSMMTSREPQVFGLSFFRRAGITLEEPLYGPVDPGYRLGPGDEVNVILTGAVQDAYPLRINREGMLVVPEAGQIVANGLTVPALESVLRNRLAGVYAGVGGDGTSLTRVDVSLGRVRNIQVYVIGDVERPGPHQVSGLGTALGALYRAGGPSRTGSFREIEVRRSDGSVQRFDLYDYLLQGNSAADVRLQHGDIVFVPPVSRRVRIEGAINRPALYELRAGDGLRDALRFAGGPQAAASLQRVQIERIVPPAERMPGIERILLDVDVARLLAPDAPDVPLLDGDHVRVFSVGLERRNVITVVGAVRRPGVYGWSPGTTLADLLERASGVTETAYRGRVHVYRLDPVSGARRLESATLEVDAGGRPVQSFVLEDRDSVLVYSADRLRPREYVTVAGHVKLPGRYALPEGATVHDMILAAGGFDESAYQLEARVARPTREYARSDTAATVFRVPLVAGGGNGANGNGHSAPPWTPREDEFVLRPGDRIDILRAPGYEAPGAVTVTGEVGLPGAYVLRTRAERVSTILAAAGGLTAEAHLQGVRVSRGGHTVSADLRAALERPGSAQDIMLQPGDSIIVPRYDPTILVTGEVAGDSIRVLYRPGMSIDDYVREAGGYTRTADRGRVSITYANGQRGAVRVLALLPDRRPAPEPGSTIHVPEKPAGIRDGPNWSGIVSQLIAAGSAVATLIIALNSR